MNLVVVLFYDIIFRMSELPSTVEQQKDLVERPEKTPEEVQAGRKRIEKQIELSKSLEKSHSKIEEQERKGLEERMERAFAELDNSPIGKAYKKMSGGTNLSEAKQTWWGTIGANTLQAGQSLANIVIHPIKTTKAVGQFARHPIDSTKQVASMYKDEWNYSNGWGKVGVAWRGAFEIVFGAKGAGTVSKVGKIGYQAGRLGKFGSKIKTGLTAVESGVSKIPVGKITKPVGKVINKVVNKIPDGIKNTTGSVVKTAKEQSRIRAIDNPLDNKLASLNKQNLSIDKTALLTGESGVVGENILEISKAITQATAIQEIVDSVGKISRSLDQIPPKQSIALLNQIPEHFLEKGSRIAQEVHLVRQRVLQTNPNVFSEQTYTKKGVPEQRTEWNYLKKTDNWTPERQKIHLELLQKNYQSALGLSNRMPEKTIVLMRGNTGVGKTSVLRGRSNSRYPEFAQKLEELNILDENGIPSGVLNPDDIKGQLRNFDKKDGKHSIAHHQLLREGAKITTEIETQLLKEGKSMVLDKRFLTVKEVERVLNNADGYDIILIDVDASLENSLARVKNRTFEGNDPIVERKEIEKGNDKMIDDREAVRNLPKINEYYFINTD